MNSATVAALALVLVLFAGPVPVVMLGLRNCQCLAFWAGGKIVLHGQGVMLVLDVSDLVDLFLRNKPLRT